MPWSASDHNRGRTSKKDMLHRHESEAPACSLSLSSGRIARRVIGTKTEVALVPVPGDVNGVNSDAWFPRKSNHGDEYRLYRRYCVCFILYGIQVRQGVETWEMLAPFCFMDSRGSAKRFPVSASLLQRRHAASSGGPSSPLGYWYRCAALAIGSPDF